MKKCSSARANNVALYFELFAASPSSPGQSAFLYQSTQPSRQSTLALHLVFHGEEQALCSSRGQLRGNPERAVLFPASLTRDTLLYARLSWGPLALHVGLMKTWLLEMCPDRRVPPSSVWVVPIALSISVLSHRGVNQTTGQRAYGGQGPGLSNRQHKRESAYCVATTY